MNRRELLTGAAVLAGIGQANAFGIGKEGARGGFGHAGAVLGRSGIPPFQAAAAFGPLKSKLNGAQNATIFVNADSTGYNAFGPYQLFLQQLAQAYSGTARLFLWGEWNVSVPTGPKAYNAAVDTVYGAGPVIAMYLAATPGQVSGYLWDGTRKAAALDGIPTPDVCMLHHGHNMAGFDNNTGLTNYATGVGLLHSTIGMTSLQWPNAPQIITTQNPDGRDTAMNNMYSAYGLAASAIPSVSKIDTYADFAALGKPSNLYRSVGSDAPGIHPSDASGAGNFDGATLQVNRLMAAFNLATAGAFTTTSWPAAAGTNLLTNGDFSNWPGAFPVGCDANGTAATVAKDTTTKYGAAAYSCAISHNGSGSATMRYLLSSAERTAIAGKTLSAAILFYQPSSLVRRAYFNFQVRSGTVSRAWVQGDLINVWDNWYLATWSGIAADLTGQDANDKFLMYPSFASIIGDTNTLRIQKIMLVEGTLPSGPFP